jgi:small subunit ribosomal protein S6
MQNYELLYIVSNQYTEDELLPIREKVNSILGKYGAQLGFSEFLGKKKLAYPIDKVNHGYYVVVEFELEDGSAIATINNDLKLDKEVLRAQIIAKPKITEKEIERAQKQRARAAEEAAPNATPKPVAKKPEAKKKVDMKQLDEKLDEILSDDSIE